MSIAVSALVKPSRLLRGLLAVYATACLAAAAAVASAAAGAYRAPWLVACCCLLAATGALYGLASAGKTRRIDISGVGEMRVTVQRKLAETSTKNTPVSLLPGSTVWPGLLMLLVRGGDGKTAVLAIFSDSVGAAQFRALAVAIRATGGRQALDPLVIGTYKIV